MLGEKWIRRLDSIGVWTMLFLMLAFFFTGLAMTKQIIDPATANYIHTHVLPVPMLLFFFIHILKPVHRQFTKWGIFKSERAVDGYVYALAVILITLILILYFR